MSDGTELDAKLIGKDPRTDLAVLKVDDKRKFTYVKWADDTKVRVGDWVVAVGNPFGLGGTVTAGIVSARGRDIGSGPYDDYIQVDAAVNRGNSGGPTFNLNGEVVGINTAIFSPSGGNVGIAFAIPADTAKGVIADLIKSGSVSRGWLGVQIQPVTKDIAESLGLSEPSGALVVSPQEGSPGQKAGIKNGDVVTAVNGETVKDPRDLARRIAAMTPGSKVEVSLWRDGKAQPLTVELGTLPAEQKEAATDEDKPAETQKPASEKALADLGLTVGPSDDGKGVAITDGRSGLRRCRPRHQGRRNDHLGEQPGSHLGWRCRQGHRSGKEGRPHPCSLPDPVRERQPLRRPADQPGLIEQSRYKAEAAQALGLRGFFHVDVEA